MKSIPLLLASALLAIALPASAQTVQKFNDSISFGGGRSEAITIGGQSFYVTSSVGDIAAVSPAEVILPATAPSLFVSSGFIATLAAELTPDPADDSVIRDGIADIWEIRYNITTFVPSSDGDQDGLPDLLEAAFNLDPGVFDAPQAFSQSLMTDAGQQYLQLAFRKNKYHTGITLVPNQGTGLASGDWTPDGIVPVSVTPIDAETDQVTVRSSTPVTSGQKQYMRLKATYTPPAP